MDIRLSEEPDRVHWRLTNSGIFTVKSMYLNLINITNIPKSINIWRVKVPLRIKVFMWFVHKKVILTKDNLAKRNWREVLDVAFVLTRRTLHTSFSNVHLREFYGRQFV